MSDITLVPSGVQTEQRPTLVKQQGSVAKTTVTKKDELQHDLAKYVVTWLGVISCIILATIFGSCFIENEKFKLLVPGLLSAVSGIIGYIAGHTAKSSK